jgi:hypothetical protein
MFSVIDTDRRYWCGLLCVCVCVCVCVCEARKYRQSIVCSLRWSNLLLLTPWSRVLVEKLTGLQLVNKMTTFYGTRKFITAFTVARHLSLSWVSPIQSIPPHLTYWRPIYAWVSPVVSFPKWPANLILLDFITRTMLGEEYRSLSSCVGHTIRQMSSNKQK